MELRRVNLSWRKPLWPIRIGLKLGHVRSCLFLPHLDIFGVENYLLPCELHAPGVVSELTAFLHGWRPLPGKEGLNKDPRDHSGLV